MVRLEAGVTVRANLPHFQYAVWACWAAPPMRCRKRENVDGTMASWEGMWFVGGRLCFVGDCPDPAPEPSSTGGFAKVNDERLRILDHYESPTHRGLGSQISGPSYSQPRGLARYLTRVSQKAYKRG